MQSISDFENNIIRIRRTRVRWNFFNTFDSSIKTSLNPRHTISTVNFVIVYKNFNLRAQISRNGKLKSHCVEKKGKEKSYKIFILSYSFQCNRRENNVLKFTKNSGKKFFYFKFMLRNFHNEHEGVMFLTHLAMRNVSWKFNDNFPKKLFQFLPATGDNFLMTHHRDFHWNEIKKRKENLWEM
jgi:hypothetical protein